MSNQKYWNADEIAFLQKHYPDYGAEYCADRLCRSIDSVNVKASKLKIKRSGVTRYNKKDAPDGYTHCWKCDQILPDGFFYKKTKYGSYGKKSSICRACCQTKARNYYRDNKDKEMSKLHSNPIKKMISNIKARAKINNIPFNLDEEDLVIPDVCPVLGIKIIPFDNSYNSPSVDRFDPNKGYVKGNCEIISKRANMIKNNASLEEIEKVYFWMKHHN